MLPKRSHLFGRHPGIGTGASAPMLPFTGMNRLLGFPAVQDFECRWADGD